MARFDYRVTRRTPGKLGRALPLARSEGVGAYLPWDGSTLFSLSGGGGINEAPLGFDAFNPWSGNPNLWTNWMTSQRWSSLTAQTTMTWIRIPVDPTPMLRNVATGTSNAAYLAMIKGAVDDCIAHGFKVAVDMHVSFDDATYSDALLRAGYNANNALWTRMKAVWLAVAGLLNQYPTSQVAFEIYNETADLDDTGYYCNMVAALVTYLRSVVGYRTTFLIAPPNYANEAGYTVPSFTAARFGANTGFVYHAYENHIFSHQGIEGGETNAIYYLRDLPFPVVGDTRAASKTDMHTRVDANGNLSAGQKTSIKADGDAKIDDHFNNYALVHTGYDGTQLVDQIPRWTSIYGGFESQSPTTNPGTQVEKWREDNSVAHSRMFITEIGVHLNYDRDGANLADAANWFIQQKRYISRRQWAYAVYDDADTYFSIRKQPGGGNTAPNGDFEPTLLDALGLWKPSTTWTPASETAGTFVGWFDATDAASITGSPASQWNDKSGAGNHATQVTSGLRPALVASGLDFSTGKYMDCAIPSNDDDQTSFAVVTLSSVSGSRTILGNVNAGAQLQWRISGGDMNMLRSGAEQEASTSGNPVTAGTRLLELQLNYPGQTVMGVDGVLQSSTGPHDTAFGATNTMRIGAKDAGSEPLNGIFREVLVLPSKPSSVLAQQIRYYLKSKWGIA